MRVDGSGKQGYTLYYASTISHNKLFLFHKKIEKNFHNFVTPSTESDDFFIYFFFLFSFFWWGIWNEEGC